MPDLLVLAQILWIGIATSTYAVLFTIAFALVLKVVQLWNFSQAGLMAVAYYAMYAALNQFGWPTPLALAFGCGVTVACALALERNPAAAEAIRRAGHDVCCHGWRWVQHFKLSEAEEQIGRAHV